MRDWCASKHGRYARVVSRLSIDKPGALFRQQNFLASTRPDAKYSRVECGGISCLACYRMTPEGLGTQANFTGQFKVTDPKTVFGPYQKIAD